MSAGMGPAPYAGGAAGRGAETTPHSQTAQEHTPATHPAAASGHGPGSRGRPPVRRASLRWASTGGSAHRTTARDTTPRISTA